MHRTLVAVRWILHPANSFSPTSEAYLIENGKVTKPVKGATLIVSGIETMQQISMVGNDLKLDNGVGVCGKEGKVCRLAWASQR